MEIKNFFAQDSNGKLIPNAYVYVYKPGTTNLAGGLTKPDGSAQENPFWSAANGQIQFGAPDGLYDLRVVGGLRDYTVQNIQFLDLIGAKNTAQANAQAAAQSATDAQAAVDVVQNSIKTVAKTVEKMRSGAAVTIVAYGDSETFGYQPNTGIQVATPYPAALQAKLRTLYSNNNITVVNSGTSGWQSDEGVNNLQAKVLNFNPDMVIVMFGINDVRGSGAGGAALTIDQYRANMSSIVKTLRKAGIEVAVMSSNPINDTTSNYHKKLLSFVRVAEEVATSYGAGFINLHQEIMRLFLNRVEAPYSLFPDNVHFADAKYSLVAEIVIARLLGSNEVTRYMRITDSSEVDVPINFSPFIETDIKTNFVSPGQFYQINLLLRSDGTTGTYLRFPFFNDVPGMDLVLKSPKNTQGGRAVFRDNGVAIKTVDFYTTETHVFEAEDTLIENMSIGLHVIELLLADLVPGSSVVAYGNAYLERFRFRKTRNAKARKPYAVLANGTLGTIESFTAINRGMLRYSSAVANDCGILLTDSDAIELKPGKTLVIEAEGKFFSGCGISWFGNQARGADATANPSGVNTGYLFYLEGTGFHAVRLYSFTVNNLYPGALVYVDQAIDYTVPHKLRITHSSAGVITIFLDGVQIIQVTNKDKTTGWFGLWSHFAGTMELSRFEYAYV